MPKTTFTLWKTRGGRLLITSESRIPPSDLNAISRYFDTWAKGPEGAILLIPDCTYAGEIDADIGQVHIVGATTPSVAGEKSEATDALPEDATGFSVDALVSRMGDRAVSPAEVAVEAGWDLADVRHAMTTDTRFEEVGVGVGRWQLTNEAFEANRSRP